MNINITDSAKVQLEKAMENSGYESPALRILFSGVGWGGPRLGLALDESKNSEEQLLKENDINIVLDDSIKSLIDSGRPIKIDYHESPYGSGFIIDNGLSC